MTRRRWTRPRTAASSRLVRQRTAQVRLLVRQRTRRTPPATRACDRRAAAHPVSIPQSPGRSPERSRLEDRLGAVELVPERVGLSIALSAGCRCTCSGTSQLVDRIAPLPLHLFRNESGCRSHRPPLPAQSLRSVGDATPAVRRSRHRLPRSVPMTSASELVPGFPTSWFGHAARVHAWRRIGKDRRFGWRDLPSRPTAASD